MSNFAIDQFCAGFSAGDAISNEALIIREHLRRAGFESNIYCEQFTELDSAQVRHYRRYHKRKDAVLIYHHSFWTEILNELPNYPAKKTLIFHNVTPSEYVEPYNRSLAEQLGRARRKLSDLVGHFDTILSDSRFNAQELQKLGFPDSAILPIVLDLEKLKKQKTPAHLDFLNDGKLNILFVGRVFPNKKHQDLLKAFHYFRQIRPDSRLICAGNFHPGVRSYTAELKYLIDELQLQRQVLFTGFLTFEEILAFYSSAHLFFSMSEHEGFFVPLLESMFFELPILAFSSSVIPETLATSGVLFSQKNYRIVSEMMGELVRDSELRRQVVARQTKRLQDFAPEKSLRVLNQTLVKMGVDLGGL